MSAPIVSEEIARVVGGCIGEYHFVAGCRESVLMEVEAFTFAREAGEANHAMAGVRIDPFIANHGIGRTGQCGKAIQQERCESQQETHDSVVPNQEPRPRMNANQHGLYRRKRRERRREKGKVMSGCLRGMKTPFGHGFRKLLNSLPQLLPRSFQIVKNDIVQRVGGGAFIRDEFCRRQVKCGLTVDEAHGAIGKEDGEAFTRVMRKV